MRPHREILRLAYRDFAHERRISLCFVLALMAVLDTTLASVLAPTGPQRSATHGVGLT